jgi:hypothetical protein
MFRNLINFIVKIGKSKKTGSENQKIEISQVEKEIRPEDLEKEISETPKMDAKPKKKSRKKKNEN